MDEGVRQRNGSNEAEHVAVDTSERGACFAPKKAMREAANALMQQRLKAWQPVMSPRYDLRALVLISA
jgi:hypothetical protein